MVEHLDTSLMKREGLDTFDVLPQDMIDYLTNYGRHFNKKLMKFAVSKMKRKDSSTGALTKIVPLSKEEVDALLETYGIKLKNNQLYDYVYVANMCKADFLKSSIPDEQHLAMYVKDVIDDDDACDGLTFTRWLASTRRQGIAIDWEAML